jgi:hypothetical protein
VLGAEHRRFLPASTTSDRQTIMARREHGMRSSTAGREIPSRAPRAAQQERLFVVMVHARFVT